MVQKGLYHWEGRESLILSGAATTVVLWYFLGGNTCPRERPAAASQRAAGRRRRSSRHSASCPCRYAAMGSITLRMFLNHTQYLQIFNFYFLLFHCPFIMPLFIFTVKSPYKQLEDIGLINFKSSCSISLFNDFYTHIRVYINTC